MATHQQLLQVDKAEQRLAIAHSEGTESAKSGQYECRYHSGSGLYTEFCDGFVIQAAELEGLPIDTPMYLAGRIAYLKGQDMESKPESESFAGRWFSGWLSEKERNNRYQ